MDADSTYAPEKSETGRWRVVETRPDGAKIRHRDFDTESEAWDWIVNSTGRTF